MIESGPAADGETLAAVLDHARAQFGDQIAYVEGEVRTTLAAHLDDARALAAAVAALGVGWQDRVAVLAGNSRLYVALWHAAAMGYFTLAPLNSRLSAAELRQVIANAEPTLLVHDARFAALAAAVGGADGAGLQVVDIAALDRNARPIEPPRVGPADIPILMYTSGTVGLPKGVEITQRGLYQFHDSANFVWDIRRAGTVLYVPTPLFHVSAVWAVAGPPLHGNSAVIVPAFSIDGMIDDSKRHAITHASVIPTMLAQLLDHPGFRPDEHQHLRFFQYGGAPIEASVLERLQRLLPDLSLVQCYGMTEAVAPLTCLTAADHRHGGARLKSCGRPLPYADVRIRQVDCIAGEGGVGEIEARSPALFLRYRSNPQATEAALSGGWYRTGDLGRFDDEGFLHVVDRLKDMIITGGENVYSQEVEHAIGAIGGVSQVAVIGIPSATWGEQVHAVVVPRPGAELDAEVILQSLRTRLAGYKCPKSFTISTEPLPLSGSNKVNKRLLKQRFADAPGQAG